MASGTATVKAVPSGDTLVLIGYAKSGPPPELSLTLSYIQAPRLARTAEQTNEAFAWESREFLRKRCIGKVVRFQVEYHVSSINRNFGSCWLRESDGTEASIATIVVQEGFAKVKAEKAEESYTLEGEILKQFESLAIAEKKGMYREGNSASGSEDVKAHASVKWMINSTIDEAESILNQLKGKLVPAIVESCRDGAFMRVLLKPTMQLINFGLSGVQCPRINTVPLTPTDSTDTSSTPAVPQYAPFAREAKHFTETRMLHRDVEVKLEGVDKYGNFYGCIVHNSGRNISIELLKGGFARMEDSSSAFTTAIARAAMRNAEKEAKQARLRIWRNYEAPSLQSEKTMIGSVIEIISGDCLVVYLPEKKEEKRIYISSLRAPRLGNAKRQESNAPYALESKEFLRHKTIGRAVKVFAEYEKANPVLGERNALMTFGSVFLLNNGNKKSPANGAQDATGTNIAVEIVSAGLAEVVRHRPEDEKSEYYDDLMTAEGIAQKKKRGVYSGKDVITDRRYTDLCFDPAKAKQYLSFLTREKALRAIVEQVYSGSRVKLFIAKENCMINFLIAGIKCPQPTRYGNQGKITGEAEPFGEEAKLYTKRCIMQREVLIEVEDMDRGGNAFGPLYTDPNKSERSNFGCCILAEGLAFISDFSVERTSNGALLRRAEESAKELRKNYWGSHDKEAALKKAQSAASAKTSDERLSNVKLSEVINGTHFFIQNASDPTCSIVESEMLKFTKLHGTGGKGMEIRRNAICAALFTDERGQFWNRVKVLSTLPGEKVRVQFIDYGNVEELAVNRLRPLDANLLHYPPQAKECAFAFLKPAHLTAEFGQDAAIMLNELAWGKPLSACIHGTDEQNKLLVSLYRDNKSISETLLEAGIVRIDRKASRQAAAHQVDVIKGLIASQTIAKQKRLCLWRYGDVESDEES